jgi:CarD family transcriptional regulator
MQLSVGEKVTYPNQGVCLVEEKKTYQAGGVQITGYSLRVLGDNSTIFVPASNVDSLGLRPVISSKQCKALFDQLAEDFDSINLDWKTRSKEFIDKLRSGDVFEAADVLKKLTFLSRAKRLSFREQTLLEKARFLIVSEVSNSEKRAVKNIESEITSRVNQACSKHSVIHPDWAAVAAGR